MSLCTYLIISSCTVTSLNSLIVYLHSGCGSKGLLTLAVVFLLLIPLTLLDDRNENRGPAAAIAFILSAVFLSCFYGKRFEYSGIVVIFVAEALLCAVIGLLLHRKRLKAYGR